MSRHARSKQSDSLRRSRAARRSVERLETRRLLAADPLSAASLDTLNSATAGGGCPVCGTGCCRHTSEAGLEYMACRFPTAEIVPVAGPVTSAVAVTSLADTFLLHSRPSATKKIYLDFDGHVTSGTAWQSGRSFTTPAYSLDSDFSTFTDAEKTAIQAIWTRVAEDFIPFDVDVTTEAPPLDDLRNTGNGDTRWGMRAVIGGDGSWMSGAAGVAYVGSFDWSTDTPCFVFAGQWWKTQMDFTANCISHEVGHTVGLDHDGYNGSEYYGGRGSGVTSWGPIMGNPGRPLVQWSNGDYGLSTNKQDDLQVMTGYGFGFRPDDHGDTVGAATMSSVPDFAVAGIIGRRTDVDVFGFDAPAGELAVSVRPLAAGANLDVVARLLDAGGAVIATSNPAAALDASFRLTVAAGRYFVSVDGAGFGDPNTTGYSDYGSLGQYTVTVGAPTEPLPTLTITDATVTEGNSGVMRPSLTLTLSAASTSEVTVQYATSDGSATTADGDYASATGTVTFAAGETQKTLTFTVTGDTKVEPNEFFVVNLSNPVGTTLGRTSATVTITNDDQDAPPPPGLPVLTVDDVSVVEGNSGTTAVTLAFVLSAAPASSVTVRYATANGTATTADGDYTASSGTVTFAAGETRKTVTLNVAGDTKSESTETFAVNLSNVSGATLARTSATVTITNDDAPSTVPTVTISGPAVVVEGNAGTSSVGFEVTLSRPVSQVTRVNVALVAGTATTGKDFRGTSQTTIVFSPNRQAVRFLVGIVGDRIAEPDETFRVVLSNPVGVALGSAFEQTVTITNDDTAAVVARSQAAASDAWRSTVGAALASWSPAATPVASRGPRTLTVARRV